MAFKLSKNTGYIPYKKRYEDYNEFIEWLDKSGIPYVEGHNRANQKTVTINSLDDYNGKHVKVFFKFWDDKQFTIQYLDENEKQLYNFDTIRRIVSYDSDLFLMYIKAIDNILETIKSCEEAISEETEKSYPNKDRLERAQKKRLKFKQILAQL